MLTDKRNKCKYIYMPRKKLTPISDRLRDAINDSPLSFKALERETGVLRQTLMDFARGERNIRLDNADKLAEYFGLELTSNKDD